MQSQHSNFVELYISSLKNPYQQMYVIIQCMYLAVSIKIKWKKTNSFQYRIQNKA